MSVDEQLAAAAATIARLPPAEPPAAGGCCERGGLAAVLEGSDLVTATEHFRHCEACQREFVSRGGLLPDRRPPAPAESWRRP